MSPLANAQLLINTSHQLGSMPLAHISQLRVQNMVNNSLDNSFKKHCIAILRALVRVKQHQEHQ